MKPITGYEKPFTPIRVGNTILKNRIIAAPITSYAEEPSPADKVESIAAKARGGAGLVIIGDCAAPRRINEAVHEGYFAGYFI